MNMTRRNFLKGLLVAAGAVAVGPLLELELDRVVAASLETVQKPEWGRLGSLMLDGIWYPLEDASITMRRVYQERMMVPNPDHKYPGQYKMASTGVRLADAPVKIDFFSQKPFDEILGREIMDFDFEVDARCLSFEGKGVISGFGQELLLGDDGRGDVLFQITLETVGKLIRKT